MKRNIMLVISLLVISALLLVGCGGASTPAPAQPAKGESAQAEKVTLRFWGLQNNAFIAGFEPLVAAYQKEHPNVEIKLETFDYDTYIQTLQTSMPAKQEADIIQLFGTWTAEYAERLAPVPEKVMSVAEAEKTFYAAPLGGYIVNGTLYGFPQEFNCEYGGVLVNKTKYEQAGLTYPPQWKTMADVVKDAQALTQKDETDMMTTAGFHFTAMDPFVFAFLAGILQRGGDYWNADHTAFTFNTPQAKETLQDMVDMVNTGVVDPVVFNNAENWVIDAFFQGKVGIGYIGTWAIGEGTANYPDFKDEWDYFFLPPQAGDKPLFAADSGWGLVVSPNSPHQDAAWDFVKFVTANPDNARLWNLASGTIPAMPAVAESKEFAEKTPWITKALGLLPYGRYLGAMPNRDLALYTTIYEGHGLNVLQGNESIEDALQAIETETNSTFKK